MNFIKLHNKKNNNNHSEINISIQELKNQATGNSKHSTFKANNNKDNDSFMSKSCISRPS